MRQPPDPNRQPHDTPRCSETYGGVVLDGLFLSVYGISSLAALTNDEGGAGLGLALLGGLHLASAIAGHNSAKRCKVARDEHEAWVVSERGGAVETDEARVRAGSRSGPCYDDKTCDEGLTCHPDASICVIGHLAASATSAGDDAEPEEAAPGLIVVDDGPDPNQVEPAPAEGDAPAAGQDANPTPAPRRTKTQSEKRDPAAPGAWFYRDFWREVKR